MFFIGISIVNFAPPHLLFRHSQRSIVIRNNSVAQAKADPRAFSFGGIKGIKYLSSQIQRNARAGIGSPHQNTVILYRRSDLYLLCAIHIFMASAALVIRVSTSPWIVTVRTELIRRMRPYPRPSSKVATDPMGISFPDLVVIWNLPDHSDCFGPKGQDARPPHMILTPPEYRLPFAHGRPSEAG